MPGPAAASEDPFQNRRGRRRRFGHSAAGDPAARSRRVERVLWLLVAVLTLAGVMLVGAIVRGDPESGSASPVTDLTSDDGSAGDGAPRGPHDAHGVVETPDATSGGAPAGWSDVARGFGLAFTRTSVGQEAWFAAMSSWLTPQQAARYRDVPIDEIPRGELVEVDVAPPGRAVHTRGTLTYDTGMVLEVGLSHVESAGGWLVARVTLAGSATT